MKPIQGAYIFKALKDKGHIVMACNTRITLVTKGIFRAAKELDAAVIIELARSECNMEGGYTGLTPKDLAERSIKASDETGFDIWSLHADHIGIKKGTPEEIEDTKKLIKSQIDAGFTSFAIDASHIFNYEGKTVEEELAGNIKATTEIAKFIEKNYGSKNFGLEVEVGEVGKKDASGMVLTTPEEAAAFIKALNRNGVHPQVIAIANGSTHGNIYDAQGNLIEQVSIDIPRTIAVAEALRNIPTDVRIAQHGITGTPLDIIEKRFPHGDIIKGNVGTFWQNIVYDIIEKRNPELYKKMHDWTIAKYSEKHTGKKELEIFGKEGKNAIKQFFNEVYALDSEIKKEIEDKAYKEAKKFFGAFKAQGSASIVREYMKKNG